MQFKSSFALNEKQIRINNAGMAPYPTAAFDAINAWNARFYQEGIFAAGDAFPLEAQVRDNFAKFLGCASDELAFMQSTAHAISQVAFGLKFNKGDEIITWEQEYPSSFYPWLRAAERSGAKLIALPADEDFSTPVARLLEQVTERTRVIAISWVQYQTGSVTDLATLRRETKNRDIWIVVDGIQGIGVKSFNFAASGIDALCGGSHKWLCSSLSTGYLAVRRERLQELEPIMVGAMTYGTFDDRPSAEWKPHTTAKRFEPGARSILPIVALNESVKLMQATGMISIEAEAMRLADKLHSGLEQIGCKILTRKLGQGSPIVTFTHQKKSPTEIMNRFTEKQISASLRGPGVRLSPHAFNTDAEIEKVLAECRQLF